MFLQVAITRLSGRVKQLWETPQVWGLTLSTYPPGIFKPVFTIFISFLSILLLLELP